jgi:acetyl-CoA carboxylase alpha subunit
MTIISHSKTETMISGLKRFSQISVHVITADARGSVKEEVFRQFGVAPSSVYI